LIMAYSPTLAPDCMPPLLGITAVIFGFR
jgi:hypothetical protein